MIEVKCNGKIYKFEEGSEIIDQLDMQAAEVTDDQHEQALQACAPGLKVYTHDVAALCVEAFEDLLDAKDIKVPCADPEEEKDRYEDPDNGAALYGTEYSELLDQVESNIIDAVMDAQRGAEIVKDVFSGNI